MIFFCEPSGFNSATFLWTWKERMDVQTLSSGIGAPLVFQRSLPHLLLFNWNRCVWPKRSRDSGKVNRSRTTAPEDFKVWLKAIELIEKKRLTRKMRLNSSLSIIDTRHYFIKLQKFVFVERAFVKLFFSYYFQCVLVATWASLWLAEWQSLIIWHISK